MMTHLKKTARKLGLPFGDRQKTYNSRLAQELGLWAESKNRGDAFHQAAFTAYFADGKNIAQIPVLLDLADTVGLPREEARTVLTKRTFKASVDRDWRLAREKSVTAVPTFIIGPFRLVGAQPYQNLAKFLTAQGASKRKSRRTP